MNSDHDHHIHKHGPQDEPTYGHIHDASTLSGQKIFWVTLLNATITISEIIGGLLSGSLSLLSDAMHNLSDTLSIVLSYVAYRIGKKPKNFRKTFGYKRIEILSAFLNALVLSVISILIIKEAINRFFSPQPIETGLMLVVATIGFFANLLSVLLLEKDSHHSLNIKSSYLHLLADTLSSVGVILGGLAIRYLGWMWVDPLLTLIIAIYILFETYHILKKTIDILMQSAPKLDFNQIKVEIEAMEHVKNIHHIHAWNMDEHHIYFEAHIELDDLPLSRIQDILQSIEHHLKDDHEIHHVTLQAECNACHHKEMI